MLFETSIRRNQVGDWFIEGLTAARFDCCLATRIDVRRSRSSRLKSIDPVGVRTLIESTRLLDVEPHRPLDLDVTNLSAVDAAARIPGHVHTFE